MRTLMLGGLGWDGVGWGAITFLAHHFHLLAHCIHVLVSMGGWGWGGVGCNNILAQCTRIGRSLGIQFHLLAHCIHVLVSMGGVGVGWGGCNNAHGLDVHLVSSSTYLLTASTSWSAWGVGWGWGGVGWGWSVTASSQAASIWFGLCA